MGLKSDKSPKGQTLKPKKTNAKYVHGKTKIDRTKGCTIPLTSQGEEQKLEPSLLRGRKKCRHCYNKTPKPCDCGKDLFETDVDVFWTETSGYRKLGFFIVRKIEDIAMAEAHRLGMSCVIIRKEHHATYTQRDHNTGKKTGEHLPADAHITVYLGDAADKLLLQGHTYVFVNAKQQPQCKLKDGNRTILEDHEKKEGLTLKDAAPDIYWGLNGSCGWVYSQVLK